MSTIRFGFTAQQIVDEGRATWEDINHLKSWLKTQHLPKLTDEQIVLFLLSCMNDQASTRATITAHFRVKERCPEIFQNRTLKREDIQKQLNTVEICSPPERTEDGYCVGFCRLYDTNFWNFDCGAAMKLLTMTLDASLQDSPPTGLIVVIDMKGTGIMHLTKLRLGLVKAFLEYAQEGLPLKLKKIHILNTTYVIDKVMYLVKPFLKQEVLDMINFHAADMDMELFYKNCIPKGCFSEDYGGDLPSVRILHQQNVQKLESLEQYFAEEELQRHGVL